MNFMQTSIVFLVMDFKFDKKDVPRICSAFDDFSSAQSNLLLMSKSYFLEIISNKF